MGDKTGGDTGKRSGPGDERTRPLTYEEAGVDVDKAAQLVGQIRAHAARAHRPEVLGGIGGFGGLFALDGDRYEEPVLVAGADGVGTKLQLAFALNKHDTVGQDCVAMCVNDIVVQGAEPLFFLDYIGTGQLEPGVVEELVRGVADGCHTAGCALLGGETAEMPGSYPPGEYDIAGFAVGVVERKDIVDGQRVQAGDAVVGLASNGVHSNGYSLVRRVLADQGELASVLAQRPPELGGAALGEVLLTPTRIYVRSVLALLDLGFDIRAMAHITGGGLTDNIPRALPSGLGVRLHPASWPRPAIFEWLRQHGPIADDEMRRTFNDGIGFVLVVPEPEAEAMVAAATEMGEGAYVIGEVVDVAQEAGGVSADGVDDGPVGPAGAEGRSAERVFYT